ncbi:galactose ABC transporter substrate-binding protein [Blautia sp.]|uniref:galactose ABC transporter substrate-binding protein n=1 Tax=Blautia sp. TaxID=1955243 RepID=UPI002E75E11E|nr:galactose ABC transporter substrate-binding protein [Blautia sp.]MEE0809647.1 galactose ABC transporter substrate-binding protein [Blautia sp.]
MKGRKKIAAGMLCCMCILGVNGCGQADSDNSQNVYVGVTYYDQSDIFLNELLDCFKKEIQDLESEEKKISVTIQGAGGSQRTQDDQVKELIDGGCNVLCVNLVDRTDPSEIIDLAREKQVPIIFFNREPVAEDMAQWEQLYYVGAKAEESGTMQGEMAAEAIKANPQVDRNKDGKIQYVVLEGEPGHQDTIIRTENAVEALKAGEIELEKLSYGLANWNRAQAENRMSQMISQYQTKIELVLANNDEMALGAMDAYEKLNYTESTLPLFFGIDGTKVGLEAVRDSRLSGTVYNDKEGQAKAMAKLAEALVTGDGTENMDFENGKYVYLPYEKVTKEQLE